MSGGRSFFDTNVLIYAYSDANPKRHAHAIALYEEHLTAGTILISTQVVQEFYAAASRKLKFPPERVMALNPFLGRSASDRV